jgi:hypothetical protein
MNMMASKTERCSALNMRFSVTLTAPLEDRTMKIGASCLTGVLGFATLATMSLTMLDTGSGPVSAKAAGAEEKPKKIIADQIRRQGFPCETAVSAERDQK